MSPDHLVAIVRPDRRLPLSFRTGYEAAEADAALARTQAGGKAASVVAIGSGRYRDLRPRAAPDELADFDLATGTSRALAAGDFFDLATSHDGRFVALLANGSDIQYPASQPLHVNTPAFRRSLVVVDRTTGGVTRPAAGYDCLAGLLAWAPRDERLLAYGRQGDRPWSAGRLLVVDASRNAVDTPSGAMADV